MTTFLQSAALKRVLAMLIVVQAFSLASFVPKFDKKEHGVKTIVIDPGHGGKDSGCLGASQQEKHIALAIGLKLGKFIEDNFDDVEVIYTRKTDVFIELHERANVANRANADLFICIHANSGQSLAFGCETYVMGNHKEEAHLKVAMRENSSILMEDDHEAEYDGFDPNSAESYIAMSLQQSAFLAHSISFADKIQKQFTALGRRDRGVKQAGFLVLYRTTMPSVLIETGFLTNKDEEAFLASPANQDKMAQGIYQAFEAYKAEVDAIYGGSNSVPEKQDAPKTNGTSMYGTNSETKEPEPETEQSESNDSSADPAVSASDNVTLEPGLVFKVQIASSSKKLVLKAKNFNGLENISFVEDGGVYRYYYGKEHTFEGGQRVKQEVRDAGYGDAFIVAFQDGKKLSLKEAMELEKARNP